MSKQPTAIAFTRKQEKFGKHILEKVQAEIEELESWLGKDEEPFGRLLDLYDDEMYWARFIEQMREQRKHLHNKYGID